MKNKMLTGALAASLGLLAFPFGALAQSANTVTPVPQTAIPQDFVQPPLPSQQQQPIAWVSIPGETINIRLVNRTGTNLNYEALTHTNYRLLPADSEIVLRNLDAPATVMLERPDRGNIRIATRSQPGLLEVHVYPTSEFNDNQGVLRVQETGGVLFY